MNPTPRTHKALIRVLYQIGILDTLAASLVVRMSRDRLRARVTSEAGKTNPEDK
jgi:hypothetical protein